MQLYTNLHRLVLIHGPQLTDPLEVTTCSSISGLGTWALSCAEGFCHVTIPTVSHSGSAGVVRSTLVCRAAGDLLESCSLCCTTENNDGLRTRVL